MVISVIAWLLPRHPRPILIRFSDNVICVRFSQKLKAPFRSTVTLSGRTTEVSVSELPRQLIYSTLTGTPSSVSGTTTFVSVPVYSRNVYASLSKFQIVSSSADTVIPVSIRITINPVNIFFIILLPPFLHQTTILSPSFLLFYYFNELSFVLLS